MLRATLAALLAFQPLLPTLSTYDAANRLTRLTARALTKKKPWW